MRADRFLVEHGYFPSRAQAQAAIKAGGVRVNGRVLRKVAEPLSEGAEIEAKPAHPWVGRGGVKLDHALKTFGISVAGKVCLDVGASTGGFTDVLLSRGAKTVFAVDVGHDQLDARLRDDARVVAMEGQDARELTAEQIGQPQIIVVDASFIPLVSILPRALELAAGRAILVALIKPQFEVGRKHVGRGGIVRDAGARERAVGDVSAFLSRVGWEVKGLTDSPIAGGSGNRESLIWAVKRA